MDDTMSKEEMIQKTKELATPIDSDQLIKDGVLAKKGTWFQILDDKKLPPHVSIQIQQMKTGSDGKALVKFISSNKSAQKLYKQLTGKEYDQE